MSVPLSGRVLLRYFYGCWFPLGLRRYPLSLKLEDTAATQWGGAV
jgi:hypothetical protein